MQTNWWVEYKLQRAFGEGFAVLLAGPCSAHKDHCVVKVQRMATDWLDIEPWHQTERAHKELCLSLTEGAAVRQLLAEAKINPFTPAVVGVDGETHTLVLGAGLNGATFKWFIELPEAWVGLQSGLNAMKRIAERCFAEGT